MGISYLIYAHFFSNTSSAGYTQLHQSKNFKTPCALYILRNVDSNIGIWIGNAVSSGECFVLAPNDTVRPINLDECEKNISSFNRCSKLFLVSDLCIE